MTALALVLAWLAVPFAAPAFAGASVDARFRTSGGQQVDKQLVVTIEGPELRGGVISEIAWDCGTVV